MKIIYALLVILVFAGCRSTYVTQSWKNAEAQPARFKKLVVIALVGDQEQESRRLMEKHMVDDLKELGYNALCSCEEYGPGFFQGLNEKEAIAKLREQGVDGILTIVLLDKKKEKTFMPGARTKEFLFWDYYQTVYDRVYAKGYYVENTSYYWESNLYDLSKNELSYSVQSKTFDPASTEILAHEYGKLILRKMTKEKVLVQQTGAILKPM